MVFYECPRCGHEFKTKQHFQRHQTVNCHNKVAELRETISHLQPHPPSPNLRTFIDLFCGIGGFHQALTSLGLQCVLACDIDEKCRQVYKDNYNIEPKVDITKLKAEEIPDFDVLCAGFPCQAFSHAGKQNGFEDTRGTLFREICRILKDKQPKYFLLENVKNLKGHDKGRTWTTIYKCLLECGYKTYESPIVLSPHQLGVPQHRERVMILGWRNDILETLPIYPKLVLKPSSIQSILTDEEAVPEETKLKDHEIALLELWNTLIVHFKQHGVKLPTFPLWSDDWDSTYNLLETQEQPQQEEDKEKDDGEPKPSTKQYKIPVWKQKFITQNREFFTANKAFLEPWLHTARQNPQFTGAKRKMEWQAGKFQPDDTIWSMLFQFRPSGIRIKRPNYSPALVAMSQIVYVGEKKRKLSPREVARLQSFPDTFKLPVPSVAYKQFGNSVNIEVIKHAAKFLLQSAS